MKTALFSFGILLMLLLAIILEHLDIALVMWGLLVFTGAASFARDLWVSYEVEQG